MNIRPNHNVFFFVSLFVFAAVSAVAQPNVLLLSVDTLRADFLGCYGCEWNTSPHIDALAKQALLFENACCEMPLTAPSFTAMLSSRYPRMTGVIRNGMRVDDKVPLITETFKKAGYYTFAVQSNWTLRARLSGLNRGFDFYEDRLEQRRWGIFNGEREAEEVTRIALEALENRPKDKAFFAWIHYSDPHAPYHFHSTFNPGERRLRQVDRKTQTRIKYASEVAYTDHHIGVLLAALPKDTRILFVADHGENLHEHGYLGHGRHLYQEGLHVPFMICSEQVQPGRCSLAVTTMDVGPTLLGLAGLHPLDYALGMNLIEAQPPADRPRFMETYGGAVPKLPGAKKILSQTSAIFQAVIRDNWKLIHPQQGPMLLYFLPDDPQERSNLYAKKRDVASELKELLERWDTHHPKGNATEVEFNTEDVEMMRSLGYLN
ncbi:MAG: sulfatase-like hydrolase/transferase [Candidatus Hydrogenedentes bacterium]|nr:sulfatase-like hydrolase/transferase [Candidatus Hydrogenedentota bacterium]